MLKEKYLKVIYIIFNFNDYMFNNFLNCSFVDQNLKFCFINILVLALFFFSIQKLFVYFFSQQNFSCF